MHRFFVDPRALAERPVRLRGDLAHQCARVLRLAPGDHIMLLDNTGAAYTACLLAVSPREVLAEIVERIEPQAEPGIRLELFQAVPRAKKIEWVLQKGTELGVSVFTPVIAERCQGLSPADLDGPKLDRWRKIVTEAAEQSGRTRLPVVEPALPLAEAVAAAACADLGLVAAVSAEGRPLRTVLEALDEMPASVALLVGPEGGFAPEEVMLAKAAGVHPITLGPRMLRTETAALVAFSAVLYALGELG